MDFTAIKNTLIRTLERIRVLQTGRTTSPQFKVVRIVVEGYRLRMEALAEGAAMMTWMGARIEGEGEAIVNTLLLLEAVRNMPDGVLCLTARDGNVIIESDGVEEVLPTEHNDNWQWPAEVGSSRKEFVTVYAGLLERVADMGYAYSGSVPESRLALRNKGGRLGVIAIGAKIGMFCNRIQNWDVPDFGEDAELSIRKRHLKALSAISLDNAFVKISLDGNKVVFDTENTMLVVDGMNLPYPSQQMDEMLKVPGTSRVTVSARDLISALALAKANNPLKSPVVRMIPQHESLRIESVPHTPHGLSCRATLLSPETVASGWVDVSVSDILPFAESVKGRDSEITLHFSGYPVWSPRLKNMRVLLTSDQEYAITIAIECMEREVQDV